MVLKAKAYQESSHEKYEVWRGGEVDSVEKEFEKFRDILMECTNDECGMRRVEERGVNGRMKKWVGRWPKREELLRNVFREEIGIPVTDTGHREWLRNSQSSCKKNGGPAMGRAIGE